MDAPGSRLIDGENRVVHQRTFSGLQPARRSKRPAIRASEWRHVTVSYTGGQRAADVRIFVDGAELATRIVNDGYFGGPSKRDFLSARTTRKVGARWHGMFDEARSFPRVLSATEVRSLFAAEALPYAAGANRTHGTNEMNASGCATH